MFGQIQYLLQNIVTLVKSYAAKFGKNAENVVADNLLKLIVWLKQVESVRWMHEIFPKQGGDEKWNQDEDFGYVLHALYEVPSPTDQIIYYLEEFQKTQDRTVFKKIYAVFKNETIMYATFYYLYNLYLYILNLSNTYLVQPPIYFYRLCEFFMLGEGCVMQKMFLENNQDTGKILKSSLNFKYERTKFCVICMESKPDFYMASLNSCNHQFCSRCLIKFIIVCMEEHKYPVPCPQCSIPLSPKNIQRLLATLPDYEKITQIFQKRKFEYLVLQNKAIFCPNPHCEDIVRIENWNLENIKKFQHQFQIEKQSKLWRKITNSKYGSEDVVQVMTKNKHTYQKFLQNKCQKCATKICIKCKSIWHDGLSCLEFQELQQSSNLNMEMILLFDTAERLGYGQCPKCKQLIEKKCGCDHISCICGADFNINRNSIKNGTYYQRPLWMYGTKNQKNYLENGKNQQQQLDQFENELEWTEIDFMQNFDDLNELNHQNQLNDQLQ